MNNDCDEGEINFNASSDDDSWIMKLTRQGIFFNRKRYPDATPDDFAQAVIELLERQFTVNFERKIPPYNRENESFTKRF